MGTSGEGELQQPRVLYLSSDHSLVRISQDVRLPITLHLHTEHITQFLEITTFKLLEDLINKGSQVLFSVKMRRSSTHGKVNHRPTLLANNAGSRWHRSKPNSDRSFGNALCHSHAACVRPYRLSSTSTHTCTIMKHLWLYYIHFLFQHTIEKCTLNVDMPCLKIPHSTYG